MRFEAIRNDPSDIPVTAKCRALGVTEQGYYAYCQRRQTPSAREREDIELTIEIRNAHETSRQTYGTPRLKLELCRRGYKVSRRRIHRLRTKAGLFVRRKRKFVKTTNSSHQQPIAPNLLKRQFVTTFPNTAWVSDITYVWVHDHWLYLCTVIDLFSRKVVGRSLKDTLDSSLVLDALHMAWRTRKPAYGCLFHSDRGSQYASDNVRAWLKEHGFTQSMSRKANCWDNAVAESSFARIKNELGETFHSDVDAVTRIYEYLDVFHNHIRIHTTIATTPAEFERRRV